MDEYIRGKLIDLTGVSFQGHACNTYFCVDTVQNARYEPNMHIIDS